MKVIEAPVWWEFTCQACKAICQAEPDDVTGIPNRDCDGDIVGYFPVVACGRCGKEHRVPANLLTPKIEQIASKKKR